MSMLDEYSRAKSKLDKSGVLSTVVAQIRAKSTNGGFVKQDDSDRWFEVGDFLAKEKTSQAFRDALHERYKSSNVSKKKRRQEEQTRAGDRFRGITRAHSDGPGIEWLSLSSRGDASLAAASKSLDMESEIWHWRVKSRVLIYFILVHLQELGDRTCTIVPIWTPLRV